MQYANIANHLPISYGKAHILQGMHNFILPRKQRPDGIAEPRLPLGHPIGLADMLKLYHKFSLLFANASLNRKTASAVFTASVNLRFLRLPSPMLLYWAALTSRVGTLVYRIQ